mgnify:CR=1 FL=1
MTRTPATLRETPWHVDILVSDGFVLIEVAAIVDVIRIANRVSAQPVFTWGYCSAHGGPIESRCRAFVNTDPYVDRPTADYAFVIGNSNPDAPALSLSSVINAYTYRNARVFLLAEAASRYIAEHPNAELAHTTHWENSALLRERTGVFDARNTIATQHGSVVTCAGMGATIDIALSVVGQHISAAATMTVADIFLHEKIRDFASLQPFSGLKSTATGDRELDKCLDLMQANIEEPLPIQTIVASIGISNRSLERKFRAHLNTTPNTYYRELRLAKANNLLLNTSLSVREIGMACGFSSGFSGLYKSFYKITPAVMRRQRRQGPDAPSNSAPNSAPETT